MSHSNLTFFVNTYISLRMFVFINQDEGVTCTGIHFHILQTTLKQYWIAILVVLEQNLGFCCKVVSSAILETLQSRK